MFIGAERCVTCLLFLGRPLFNDSRGCVCWGGEEEVAGGMWGRGGGVRRGGKRRLNKRNRQKCKLVLVSMKQFLLNLHANIVHQTEQFRTIFSDLAVSPFTVA